MSALDLTRPLIIGFGITGQAVATALLSRGIAPVVVDDRPNDTSRAAAVQMGLALVESPAADELADHVAGSTVILPSPGVPDHHPVFTLAGDTPIASEFDLASSWDDRPLVAITGTNGKTTVTMMVTDALNRSGVRASAVGNTETPLVAALIDESIDCFVVEASSFRLAHSHNFRPSVAAWLNFAPDHLDAHATLADYEAAKASIWADLLPGGVAVVAAEDDVVWSHRPTAVTTVSFGLSTGDWSVCDGQLVGPEGSLIAVDRLVRQQPHDLSNAAAAAAIATAAGASYAAVAEMLANFAGLPHRVELVGEADGIAWYNDSKATVPHATLAAIGGFDSVVLIAGGRNKGLDLRSLATAVPPVKAVVATGDAAAEITAAFTVSNKDGEQGPEGTTIVPVERADDMAGAIALAAGFARPGDVVLLSPSCTSYDWYPNYVARGLHFTELVQEHLA